MRSYGTCRGLSEVIPTLKIPAEYMYLNGILEWCFMMDSN